MTDLDRRLQQIASEDWERFKDMIGENAVIAAKTCLLRGEGKSYHQISIKLMVTESQVRYACGKCTEIVC